MDPIVIEITPKGAEQWEAWLGERLLVTRKEPFCTAARVLLEEGVAPETLLAMRHRGTSYISLRSTVGKAAALTIEEGDHPPRFRKYRAYPERDDG